MGKGRWKRAVALILAVTTVLVSSPIQADAFGIDTQINSESTKPVKEQQAEVSEGKDISSAYEPDKKEETPEAQAPEATPPILPSEDKGESETVDQPLVDAIEKPEDTRTLGELFLDEKVAFEVIIDGLFKEEKPIKSLLDLEESVRNQFFEKLPEKELYQFSELYRYAIFNFIIEDSVADDKMTKDEVDTVMSIHFYLLSLRDKNSWHQEKAKYDEWSLESFEVLAEKTKDIKYMSASGEEEKTVVNYTTYAEYLQTLTSIPVTDFLDLVEVVSIQKIEEQLVDCKEGLKTFMYSVYGYKDVEEDKEEGKDSNEEVVKPDGTINVIYGFDNFDVTKSEAYTTLNVADETRSEVFKMLPTEMSVNVGKDRAVQTIPVTWNCADDILTSKASKYIFRLELPVEYTLSKELQEKIQSKEAQLPTVEVNIKTTKSRMAQSRGTFSNVIMKPSGMVGGTETHYWWVFVKVNNPSVTPTLAYRPSYTDVATNVSMEAGTFYQDGDTYNYAYPIKVVDGFYGEYVCNVNVEGNWIGAQRFTMGSMRIDSNYYWDLQAAINAAGNGTSIYVVQNCAVNAITYISNKNINIRPDGKDVSIICNIGNDKNAIICVGSNVNLGGGSGTLTLNGNGGQISEDTGLVNLAGSGGSLTMLSNARIYNSGGTGLISQENSTLTIESGALIYGNGESGISSAGNVYIKGGSFFDNGQDGVTITQANSTSLTVSGGSFYSNGRAGIAFGGILPSYSGKTYNATLSGGDNYNNSVGLYITTDTNNYWNVNATGIAIHDNHGGMSDRGAGVFINPRGTLILNGSNIYNNSAASGGGIFINGGTLDLKNGVVRNNSATNGGGIYSAGALVITGGTISDNSASNYGGGIFAASGTVDQITAAVLNNTATAFGGGIFSNISIPLSSCTITGNRAVNNSGGGVYLNDQTATITNCNISSNSAGDVGGGIATWQGTINYNSGSINSNVAGNYGGAIAVSGTSGNSGDLIVNDGDIAANRTTNYYGGAIFNNSYCNANIRGGSIYGNNSSHGGAIFNNTNAALYITNGSIYQNTASYGGAIFNQSDAIFNLSGGTIYGNSGTTAGGGVYNTGAMNTFGGDISSNTSPLGSCIYQNAALNINGATWFNNNNDIYLPVNKVVTVATALSSAKAVALITPADYTLGRVVVRVSYGAAASAVYQKFVLRDYASCLLRPGDYEDTEANTSDTDVVISRRYTIHYDGNNDSTGEVQNLPGDTNKYWYESVNLSTNVPVMGTANFKGWNEDKTAQQATYQPNANIADNRDLTLYAIWDAKIKVTYVGTQADSGSTKSEYVTVQECKKNNGYEIRKNKDYTNFTKKDNTFAGWVNKPRLQADATSVKYAEKNNNKISFEELKQIAEEQKQEYYTARAKEVENTNRGVLETIASVFAMGEVQAAEAGDGVPEVIMYDVWDTAPKIKADGIQEFYEGTEVTKEMLLQNVKGEDKEDGELTENLRIVSIEYSDGKLMDGVKQTGTKVTWKEDMPDDYKLDTWFLQLDQEDSPVIHKITYAVTDSAGNETKLDWTLKVIYNEFPVIEAEDRYFTLEEAKSGSITEDLLTKDAVVSGKLVVTDKEEDALYPGTIASKVQIANFKPDEFKSFTDSGYVVLTYTVQDSMGPDGKGKETFCQFTVHIVKDGEIVEPDAAKYVRFINKKNYEKNLGLDVENLSDTEREECNQNGGLNVDSKWYQDPDYMSVISTMWEEGSPDETWKFSHEEVQKVKEYIDAHGIGNSQESTALSQFVDEFAN